MGAQKSPLALSSFVHGLIFGAHDKNDRKSREPGGSGGERAFGRAELAGGASPGGGVGGAGA